jgi:hypothetical protein
MSMEKTYEVAGTSEVAGHKPGERFRYTFHPELEGFLIDGGAIRVVTGPKAKADRLHCPACEAHGTKTEKAKTYADLLDLREHYGKAHPALAAPAGEEE